MENTQLQKYERVFVEHVFVEQVFGGALSSAVIWAIGDFARTPGVP